MKILATFISLLGLSLACFIPSTALAQPTQEEIREVVEQYVEKRGFAGTVLIARQGEVVFEAAYGDAIVEWGVKNTLDARYRIGSLSKPFLATLVMKLAEKGELSLDDTLAQHLPEIYEGTKAASVTVSQLMAHTSGIGDLPGRVDDPWYETTARLAYEPDQLAREWIKPDLKEEPGSTWRYNNAGFILLGMIVEAATGKSYAANLDEHVFGPAEMASSGVFTEDIVLSRLTSGYAKGPDGKLTQPIRVDASVFFSAAGIYSTAYDILRFDTALYDPSFIGANSRTQMHSKQTDFPYGLGWGVETWPLGGDRTLGVTHHTGSIPGYQSFYIRSEENRDAVIVLNNTNNGSAVIEMGRNLIIMLNNGVAPDVKRRLADDLSPIAFTGGVEALQETIDGLSPKLDEYDASERTLNRYGYDFMREKKPEIAIVIFKWATQLYPQSANLFDSLGEGYRAAGNIEASIESYERALALDPSSESAAKALSELRAN